MEKEDVVWLGTPVDSAVENLSSAFTSRIGGKATLFRETTDYTPFHCPKCKGMNTVSLLAQIYAPLEVYDRVLYIFTCTACSTERSSFCFALRSQNFNPSYVNVVQAAEKADRKDEGVLFEENADWGDEGSDGWGSEIEEEEKKKEDDSRNNENVMPNTCKDENDTDDHLEKVITGAIHTTEAVSFSIAPPGSKPPIKGLCYPVYELEIIFEPPKVKAKSVALKDQLHKAQEEYGEDAVETTVVEDDIEPLHEKRLRKYVDRIGRVPSQCIRWAPGKEPLQSSVTPIVIPQCQHCGKERHYELQLTSPIIYFLTRMKGENNHSLHFGNVLVFTCAGNCNANAYASEYCIVEEEI